LDQLINFTTKIPCNLDDFHPSKAISVTFLNPYSYTSAERKFSGFHNFDIIAPDGILIVLMLNLMRVKKFRIQRFSFDMTSVAPYVLQEAQKYNYDVYFLGTKSEFIVSTIQTIKSNYPNLIIAGFRHGFFDNDSERMAFIAEVIKKSPKIIIIGMGTPYQETMAVDLRSAGFRGAIYTCGGFLHQTSQKLVYYPRLIDKLHLRLPYRMYKEKGVLKRSLMTYPIFCCKFPFKVMKLKLAKGKIINSQAKDYNVLDS
jgi:exopolysaccharide biosynthesis WecB/TagA/CpsF family protein